MILSTRDRQTVALIARESDDMTGWMRFSSAWDARLAELPPELVEVDMKSRRARLREAGHRLLEELCG